MTVASEPIEGMPMDALRFPGVDSRWRGSRSERVRFSAEPAEVRQFYAGSVLTDMVGISVLWILARRINESDPVSVPHQSIGPELAVAVEVSAALPKATAA